MTHLNFFGDWPSISLHSHILQSWRCIIGVQICSARSCTGCGFELGVLGASSVYVSRSIIQHPPPPLQKQPQYKTQFGTSILGPKVPSLWVVLHKLKKKDISRVRKAEKKKGLSNKKCCIIMDFGLVLGVFHLLSNNMIWWFVHINHQLKLPLFFGEGLPNSWMEAELWRSKMTRMLLEVIWGVLKAHYLPERIFCYHSIKHWWILSGSGCVSSSFC